VKKPRVLIVDDSAAFCEALRESLEVAGDEVLIAGTGDDGLRLAASARPHAVVVGSRLPGGGGGTLIRTLKLDAALRRTPCLLLIGPDEAGEELAALEAGADAFVRRSETLAVIAARVAALLRATTPAAPVPPVDGASGPRRVLAVDDSKSYLALLASEIREDGYEVVTAASGEEALALLGQGERVDCILLDLVMPGLTGQETAERIKSEPAWRDIPLIILSTRDDPGTMIETFNLGADDYILKSSSFEVVKARLRAQIRRKQFEDEDRRIREELLRKEREAAEARAAQELAETRAALARARQQLEADSLLRAVAEGTTDVVYVKDRAGRYLMINSAGARLLGKSVAEVIGRDDRAFFPLEVAETLRDADRVLMDSGSTSTSEEKRTVGGATHTFLTTKGPHRDDSGRVIGLIGIARDITERKRAEVGQRFLSEATTLLAASFDTDVTLVSLARLTAARMADCCLIHLAEGDGVRLISMAHAHPARAAVITEQLTRPPLAAELQRTLTAVLNPNPPPLREGARAWRGMAGSGAELPEGLRLLGARSYICVPLVARGRALGTLTLLSECTAFDALDLGMATELARRAALAVDNARLYRQATEAIHARDDFLAIASHELRTPLAALVLQVQSLQGALHLPGMDSELASQSDRVVRHVSRLGNLIERLLDVSKITAGRLELDPENVDLAEVVRDVCRRLGDQARVEGSTISVEAPERTVGVWDRMRMEQIVTNLVSNAVKYGAGKPVEVRVESDEQTARLTVRDAGIGISVADVQRIFARFERAVPARHYAGMGLGLYITRQAVEAHGGTIHVASEPGRGAVFTVDLPRRNPELVERRKSKSFLLGT
jgi:PAS domain S-box-containing protein